jgi:hypothetical protein
MIYYSYINLPWNERKTHIWIGHCTFFHLNFVYECSMDQKYMCFGIKKQTPNYTWYVMYTLHICNHLKIWSFDQIKVVANWIGHKSLYVFDCLFTFWPFNGDGNLKFFLKTMFCQENKE